MNNQNNAFNALDLLNNLMLLISRIERAVQTAEEQTSIWMNRIEHELRELQERI